MRILTSLTAVALCLGMSMTASAASADVKFEKVDDYNDIRTANGSRSKFKEKVLREMEEHFTELASELPEDQKLSVTVTNIDLAGHLQLIRTQQIRVLKEIYIPRISFSYALTDSDGKELKSDTVEVKDMDYLRHSDRIRAGDSFWYEKNMLTEWFNKNLK